ncbi:MAG: DNA polymerase III subunit beta [Bdellovibrionaceae bacterium]|nr:DNA polymerase III subunit beta [Pseudobdellovibrionaceae bacterium]NUM59558.1 DNA polymerase III subunit beta [Pseudobdellovibrionaceae bacterium]
MKIEIEKKDLLNLIGKTLNIVDKKNTMAVLVNVLLDADHDRVKVFATDLEVSLTDEVYAKVIESGKVVVSTKNLFEICKKLDEGKIQFIKKENNWLEIKQGRFSSRIVGVSHEDYPIFPTYNPQYFLKMNALMLKEMIDKTIYSVSNDETRYHLNGVYFEINSQNNCRMVATDGHRLSLVNKQLEQLKHNLTSGVIIPRKGLFEIKKIIENNTGTIEIAIEGSQFYLKNESTVLMIRLIEGKYPNYQQFIPQKLPLKILVNKNEFLTSLERVALLANQKSKAVLLNLANKRMEISSNNPELGEAKEEIEVEYSGSDLKIGFNARYLLDVLAAIDEEKVLIEINDHLSPGVVRPNNDPNYTCVVMPMRI